MRLILLFLIAPWLLFSDSDTGLKYLNAGLYELAIRSYDQFPSQEPERVYHQSCAYFLNQNFEKAIFTVQAIINDPLYGLRARFLLASAYRRIGNYESAIATLESSVNAESNEETQFEFALSLFLNRSIHKAIPIFTELYNKSRNMHLRNLSALYLGRSLVEINEYEKAYSFLKNIEKNSDVKLALKKELHFILGEAAYKSKQFVEAVNHFQQALPSQAIYKTPWYAEALYYLGWSYLQLAQNATKEKEKHFCLAENAFKNLLNLQTDAFSLNEYQLERTALALRSCYLLKHKGTIEAHEAFSLSAASFEKANIISDYSPLTLQYHIEALVLQDTPEALLNALNMIDEQLKERSENDEEFLTFKVMILSKLIERGNKEYLDQFNNTIANTLTQFPKGKRASLLLNISGVIAYNEGNFIKAEEEYLKIREQFPGDTIAIDALYWLARCADGQNDTEKGKSYRRQLFENFPQSTYADEAFFSYYSYSEYLCGERKAIKHLQEMTRNYPRSPFSIDAFYLIGLDYKRDRKTPEGRWIRKKNLISSIEAFQQVETLFDSLIAENRLKINSRLAALRFRTTLEKAAANLAVAEESQGTKRHIYLEYAGEVFQKIIDDLSSQKNSNAIALSINDSCSLLDEALLNFSQVHSMNQNDLAAKELLDQLIAKHETAGITRGYFLSRAYYENAQIAMRKEQYEKALIFYDKAEDSGKGKALNADQKIDIWIQKSLCRQALGDLDTAILLLSQAVNDSCVSSQRIKAMYLRAEMYQKTNRQEQARRQLEAAAKKGGEWSQKAKEKLERDYGY